MSIKHLLFALALGLVFTACGSSGGESGNSSGDAASSTEASTEDTPEEDDKSKRKSPAKTAEGEVGTARITITYGSPAMRGRTIYGGLIPYNELWRTGANEATIISVSERVLIEGLPLPPGDYALFSIPGEDKWTFVFNKEAEQWGTYDYDESMDALRVEVAPRTMEESVEMLEFAVKDGEIILRWEKLEVPMKVAS